MIKIKQMFQEINCGLPGNGLLPNGYFEGVRGTSLGAQISFK